MHARRWCLCSAMLIASAVWILNSFGSHDRRDVTFVFDSIRSFPGSDTVPASQAAATPVPAAAPSHAAATPVPAAAPSHAAATPVPAAAPSQAAAPPVPAAAPPHPTMLPDHKDDISQECHGTVSDELVMHWRMDGARTVCRDAATGINITEFSQPRLEYKPHIRTLENVDVENIFSDVILPSPCPKETFFEEEKGNQLQPWAQGKTGGMAAYEDRSPNITHIRGRTIVHIKRFDPFNPYEAYHSYLNMYLAARVLMLNMSTVQIVFTDFKGHSAKDEEIWESVTGNAFPLLTRHKRVGPPVADSGAVYRTSPVRIERLVQSSSSGTSLLSSNKGPLHGRGANHNCKSEIFREASHWLRNSVFQRHGATFDHQVLLARPLPRARVIWVSRKPYPREGKLFHVKRVVSREAELVRALQERLGAENFSVTSVNFASLNAFETIKTVTESDVVIGLHGAGLMWSAFLPRHGGLVEIFGGDRGMRNRHFHNMAKLADLHYRSMLLFSPGGMMSGAMTAKRRVMDLKWSLSDVDKMADLVRSIPLHSVVEP